MHPIVLDSNVCGGPVARGRCHARPVCCPRRGPEPIAAPVPSPTPVHPRFYGWLQQGYTANLARPADGVSYGVNFNWRPNGYLFDQAYFVYDKPLEQARHGTLGWRVDLLVGNDAPFLSANGLLSGVTGYSPTSGFGSLGPSSYRNVERPGLDFPQAFVEAHLPGFITRSGTDLPVGKFYSLLGREVYLARDADF